VTRTQATARTLTASILALAVLHVIFGETLTRWLPLWSGSPEGRPYWSRGIGLALAVTAASLLARPRARRRNLLLAALLALPVLALHLPRALASGELGGAWLGVFKWSTLAAAPLLLGTQERASDRARPDPVLSAGLRTAPFLFAAFMMLSAILHVRQDEFVAQLMQPWVPWRMFWTYFAAVALAAGAVGLLLPRTRHLAALMTSLMIFMWFWIVHLPRMLIDPLGPVGWSELAESLAFSAMALLLALSVRPPAASDEPGTARSSAREPAARRL
jgi:uncharacterized membrane protein